MSFHSIGTAALNPLVPRLDERNRTIILPLHKQHSNMILKKQNPLLKSTIGEKIKNSCSHIE